MMNRIRPLARSGAEHERDAMHGQNARPRCAVGAAIGCLVLFVSLIAATPAHAQTTAYAVTTSNHLISFDINAPGSPTDLGVIKNPSGVPLPDQIVAMDFRPKTGQLYGLGSNAIYLIDTVTATASP